MSTDTQAAINDTFKRTRVINGIEHRELAVGESFDNPNGTLVTSEGRKRYDVIHSYHPEMHFLGCWTPVNYFSDKLKSKFDVSKFQKEGLRELRVGEVVPDVFYLPGDTVAFTPNGGHHRDSKISAGQPYSGLNEPPHACGRLVKVADYPDPKLTAPTPVAPKLPAPPVAEPQPVSPSIPAGYHVLTDHEICAHGDRYLNNDGTLDSPVRNNIGKTAKLAKYLTSGGIFNYSKSTFAIIRPVPKAEPKNFAVYSDLGLIGDGLTKADAETRAEGCAKKNPGTAYTVREVTVVSTFVAEQKVEIIVKRQ